MRFLLFILILFIQNAISAQMRLDSSRAEHWVLRGDEALAQGKWTEAEGFYQQAASLERNPKSDFWQRKVRLIALRYQAAERYDLVQNWAKKLLQEASNRDLSPDIQAFLYHIRLRTALHLGAEETALDSCMKDYETLIEVHFDTSHLAYVQWQVDLSSYFLSKGLVEKSIATGLHILHFLERRSDLKESDLEIQLYDNLSKGYYLGQEVQQAEYYRERSIALLERDEELAHNTTLLEVYGAYIDDLLETQKPYKALPFLRKTTLGLGQLNKGTQHKFALEAAHRAAAVYWALGDTLEAGKQARLFEHLRQGQGALSKDLTRRHLEILAILNDLDARTSAAWWDLCEAWQAFPNFPMALRYVRRRYLGTCLEEGNLAGFERVWPSYEQGSKQEEAGFVALLWGRYLAAQGKELEALTVWQRGLEQEVNLPIVVDLLNQKAQALYRLYRGSRDELYLERAYLALRDMGRYLEAAPEHRRRAFALFSPLKTRLEGIELGLELSWKLYQLRAEPHYQRDFFFWLELARSLEWRDQIWRSSTHTNTYLSDSLANLEHLHFVWKPSRKEQALLMNHLHKEHPRYFDFKYGEFLEPLDSLRAILDPEIFYIEYLRQEQDLYVLTLYRGQVGMWQLSGSETHWQRLTRFLTQLKDLDFIEAEPTRAYQNYVEDAYALYRWLLQPLQIPSSAQRLLISPDQSLLGLPFEALLWEFPKTVRTGDFKNLPYVLRNYRIGYAHSATQYLQNCKFVCLPKNTKLLGLGPQYRRKHPMADWSWGENLLELNQATRQMDLLSGFIPGQYLRDSAASEAAYLQALSGSSMLHLMARSQANPYQPMAGGFLLAPFSPEGQADDLLQAVEIAASPLNLDLVFLPACEGDPNAHSLMARSFMFAGTPSVLFGFWSQDNEAGNYLIEHFYQALKLGLDKDLALQQAKLEYLASHQDLQAHPYFWAGLNHWGDARPSAIEDIRIWWLWIMIGSALGGIALGLFRWWNKEHVVHQDVIFGKSRLTFKRKTKA